MNLTNGLSDTTITEYVTTFSGDQKFPSFCECLFSFHANRAGDLARW